MMKWMRTRLLVLAAMLVVVFALTGCGGAKEEAKPAAPAPAAQAQPAPAPAPVDKGAILKEAAVAYFNTLPPSSNMIDPADVKKKIEAKDTSIFLLDIRKAEDFAAAHVDGFTNIAMGAVGANIDKLPKDKQIVVTCYSGQTSGQTVAVLKMAGYNAISLKGGFPALEKTGIAVIKK